MTRIIAGRAGGLRLSVPPSGTRPTSDRVRESLFGALDAADAIDGCRVLDLYAGTGALGLEALSRGASSVVLVESAKTATALLRRNADTVSRACGGARAEVAASTVQTYLQRGQGHFDLVFSDPPYDLDDASMTENLLALRPLLSPSALVVIERAKRSSVPDFEASGLELERDKSYGDTRIWWATPAA